MKKYTINPCILETHKQVIWQTVKTLMKCSIMHCFLKKKTLRAKIHHNLENSTMAPYCTQWAFPYFGLILSICMGKFIRIQVIVIP